MPAIRVGSFADATGDWGLGIRDWESSATGINGNRGNDKVQNTDVAIQIEGELHFRKIAFAHERLFVNQQPRNGSDAEEIHSAKSSERAEHRKAHDGACVHR